MKPTLTPAADALSWILAFARSRRDRLGSQTLSLPELTHRVLAEDVFSQQAVPHFRRVMMDGLAIRAQDLSEQVGVVFQVQRSREFSGTGQFADSGQSDAEPVTQTLDSEKQERRVACQQSPEKHDEQDSLETREANPVLHAWPVVTGSVLPQSCDCVVPIEQWVDLQARSIGFSHLPRWVQIRSDYQTQAGQNVAPVGEDVAAGARILSAGRRVRPQDLGLLAGCGIGAAGVMNLPQVSLLITGDEVVPWAANSTPRNSNTPSQLASAGPAAPGTELPPGMTYDANALVLSKLIERDLGTTATDIRVDYCGDDRQAIAAFLRPTSVSTARGRRAKPGALQVKIVCGGTSAGPKDFAPDVLRELGQVKFQGLSIRPGRPVAMGAIENDLVFLLPGNPIACQFAYDLLVRPALQVLSFREPSWPYFSQTCALGQAVESQLGRMDYLRVALGTNAYDDQETDAAPVVFPITSGKASALTSVSQAVGFVIIDSAIDRIEANSLVKVYFYDA